MNSEIIFDAQKLQQGGYEATALGHLIFIQANTVEELRLMVKDAVECHFEEEVRAKIIRLHFVREELLAA